MAPIPLQLPAGLERNNTPFDTIDRWYDMNLIRWTSGSMVPVGGWNRLTAAPLDTPARTFSVWRNNSAARMVLVGTDFKLYVDDSGGYADITPEGFEGPGNVLPTVGGFGVGPFGDDTFGTPRSTPSPIFSPYGYWSMDTWGEDAILTANTDGRLFYYDQSSPTAAPTVIADAPVSNNSAVVTGERHVILIGSGGDPRQIAWCSREDINDWDFDSVTNTAGFLNLKSRTPLLKGWTVAEGTLVMSYTDVFLIRYTGLPYVYGGTDPIAETSMFNPASVATFDAGKAVWPSRNGFQLYSGGYVQPLPCPFLNEILNGQDDTKRMDPLWGPFRMHASANGRFPEVWFFYPSVGRNECNRYIWWNYVEGTWGWGELARSAMHAANAYQFPYMGASDGHVFEHEKGWLDNGASRVGQVWVETGNLSIADGATGVELSQLRVASGSGYDAVAVSVFGRYAPEDVTEYTEGPFLARSDGYTDARADYLYMRLRFENAKDGPFAVGRILLDAKPNGDQR